MTPASPAWDKVRVPTSVIIAPFPPQFFYTIKSRELASNLKFFKKCVLHGNVEQDSYQPKPVRNSRYTRQIAAYTPKLLTGDTELGINGNL